jgi:hydroxymethylglutaryl-CoA synthase
VSCAEHLFTIQKTKAKDYQYAVFHQPNGKFPIRVAKILGFSKNQIQDGLLVVKIGNTYSGAVPLGLANILDVAKPGDRIFAIAYGSGAGADGFDLTVTEEIENVRANNVPTIQSMVNNKEYLEYSTYAKFRGKILMRDGD